MALTRTWDGSYEASPADGDDISEGAGKIRNLKVDVQERGVVDHSWAGDADDGKHKQVTYVNPLGSDPADVTDEGVTYTKNVNSKAELFWKDEDGNVAQISSVGAILAAMSATTLVKSGAYPIVAADRGKLILANANGGAFTVTFLLAATAGNGFIIGVKKTDSSANAVTVDGNGAETIDGVITRTLNNQYDVEWYVCDGSNWHVLVEEVTGVAQVVNTQTGAVNTGTTVIPFDNTKPQKTEGDEYMTLAVTPKNALNWLIIEVVAVLSNGAPGAGKMIVALFQDAVADALAAVPEHTQEANVADFPHTMHLRHKMVAGTTSEIDFKVRAGFDQAGTTTFNGAAAGGIFDGVMASSITITEIAR